MAEDFFFFLRGHWLSDAENVILNGDKIVSELDSIKVTVTPETASAGKVYFSKGKRNTYHFHSAEDLVDVLIEGLEAAGFSNEEIKNSIDTIFC